MTAKIDMGSDSSARTVELDLEELLATRLLVQGNSGSGKSHLLRRLLEGSAGLVQQVVIDPEGDFVSLADAFDHIAVDAAAYSLGEVTRLAQRAREHRASVVLNLEGLEVDEQMRCAAAFLSALFDAPREQWFPVLVVVDEAQLFAPAAAGEVSEEARRVSLAAMTNLMCRGRKRGLAGVIATQRLAKLAKNVAAEASNFLMGRTFLDIDMARAADLLGMDRRQADTIRDLSRGEFMALGPAISRRPISVRIGSVATAAKNVSPKLIPLPKADEEDLRERLFAETEAPPPPPPPPAPMPLHELMRRVTEPAPAAPVPEMPPLGEEEAEAVRTEVAAAIAAERARVAVAQLYQDYEVRCRMRGVAASEPLDRFRRRLAMAQAGLDPAEDWGEALVLAAALPEDMWAPFLALARAGRSGEDCPDDAALAELYGTVSPRRARRMLEDIQDKGLIVVRIDLTGKRSISLPHLGWTTGAALPEPVRDLAPRRAGSTRR
ncbi:helicase HerA domain-containing protein [Sphingomonas sp.]|uniref:helicase HerA domain-containing protein n=1 Tax=Sphingomonas sp. TaxID=28214 RepID=UPI0035C8696A